jgi:hypothetical protein
MRPAPEPGQIYRHYKGGEYEIEAIAAAEPPSGFYLPAQERPIHTETGEELRLQFRDTEHGQIVKLNPHIPEAMVLYFSPRNPSRLWARPLVNFMEVLGGAGCKFHRFEKVEAIDLLTRPILQPFASERLVILGIDECTW